MSTKKSKDTAVLGIFIALILVLQSLSLVIPPVFGASLSFVLIPIALAAVMYGTKYSTILGLVFGIIVAVFSMTGLEAVGATFFNHAPVVAIALILVKGIVAGFGSGVVATMLIKKNLTVATFAAAAITPIINTGIFLAGTYLFFIPALENFLKSTEGLQHYTVNGFIVGIILFNFVFEFILNIVLAPAILRVTKALECYNKNAVDRFPKI